MNKLTKAQSKRLGGAIKDTIQTHNVDPSLHGSFLKRIKPVLIDELARQYEVGYEDGENSGHADVVLYLDTDATDWKEAIKETLARQKKEIIKELECTWTGVIIKNKCYYRISMDDWKAIKTINEK